MSKKQEKRKKFAEHSEKLCKPTAKKHDAWRLIIYSALLLRGSPRC
ncbi:hypothetical protein US8_03778 [Bacillus altitudinis]|nr:hypothetical protein US8_03778 [Bacillus altitudinis]